MTTKLAIQLLLFSLLASSAMAQERSGFDWLTQFEGTWNAVSSVPGADESTPAQTAIIRSRIIGKQWVINEFVGPPIAGIKFEAVQTLGYDPIKKEYKGTWVDSMMSHTWQYKGTLNETGSTLRLVAEGPDMRDMSKTKMYRDTYEFKSENEIAAQSQMQNDNGDWETFMTSKITRTNNSENQATVTPFLMFKGSAGPAIKLYQEVFEETKIESMEKYQADEAGKEGTVKVATISIEGQNVKLTDSPQPHGFGFTPSFSFFVECEDTEQLKVRFAKLSEGGKVMMPIDNYGFSQQFGWCSDQYGINWQLNVK